MANTITDRLKKGNYFEDLPKNKNYNMFIATFDDKIEIE